MSRSLTVALVMCCWAACAGFRPPRPPAARPPLKIQLRQLGVSAITAAVLALGPAAQLEIASADTGGVTSAGAAKIAKGAASTQGFNTGSVKTITRGAALDGSDFSGKDLKGVSFQQSLVRNSNFRSSNLQAASFFDADLSFSDLTGATLNQANLELTCLDNTVLRDAVITEAYVSGATKINDVDIENSDWTDTELRKDQRKYLCNLPTAKGTNPTTGVETRESLRCD